MIMVTFINLAFVILSASLLSRYFKFSGFPEFDLILEVAAVAFFLVLLGEVIPKVYATRRSLQLAGFMAGPLSFVHRILGPLSFLLVASADFIENFLKKNRSSVSVDELTHAIEITSDDSVNEREKKILKGIAKFGTIDVKQIMQSRADVMALEYRTDFRSLLEKIKETRYSRIPVYLDHFDKITGILYIKDVLKYTRESDKFRWQKLLRPPYFVPETKKINNLLKEFKNRKNHLAIVVDEFGGASGIVTMEDILEEIVGDINDEFDDDELVYSRLDAKTFVFEGKTHLNDFFRITEIPRKEFDREVPEADTLAGLLLEIAGKIPKTGEAITFGPVTFISESADRRRIHRIKVMIHETERNIESTDP